MLIQIIPTDPDINAPNNCGNTRLHVAVALCDEQDVDTCKVLIRQGADLLLENNQGQNALYMATVVRSSVPISKTLLVTSPCIKPILKTILLSFKRYGRTLPKAVLINCIVPHIIDHAAEQQLRLAKKLLTKKYIKAVECYPQDWLWAVPATKYIEESLYEKVEKQELKALLHPDNHKELKEPIIQELYASIGIKSTKSQEPKDKLL